MNTCRLDELLVGFSASCTIFSGAPIACAATADRICAPRTSGIEFRRMIRHPRQLFTNPGSREETAPARAATTLVVLRKDQLRARLGYRPSQLVVERFHRRRDGSGALHAPDGGADIRFGAEERIFQEEDVVPRLDQTEHRLQHADVGLTAGDGDLAPSQPADRFHESRLTAAVEGLLGVTLPVRREERLQSLRQPALGLDRLLEGGQKRHLVDGRQGEKELQPRQQRLALPGHPALEEIWLHVDDDDRQIVRVNHQSGHRSYSEPVS